MERYAGIGSRRRTPAHIMRTMTLLAAKLEGLGYVLRSGGAQGCDKAFEAGVKLSENKRIYRPKHATFEAIKLASEYHPAWDRCTKPMMKLHGRNSMIILGENLDRAASFVVCHTPDGKYSGGTGQGLRMADSYGIPIFNMYYASVMERIKNFIGTEEEVDLF